MAKVEGVAEIIERITGRKAEAKHTIVYDSSSDTLEPLYFWTLDLMNDFGLAPDKLIDNFTSSPGSGHFSELGQRATIMQQQGAKIMGDINTVLRSVLNIIYDLKEFRIRLSSYDSLKDEDKKNAAILSLKQIWLDKVDINKGNSSIKIMMSQMGFQTLLDAFLFAKNTVDAEKIDLNERVKRILISRIQEFNVWVKESEKELKKRYEMEKTYLKSQVNSLKLYSRWAKPYLKAAMQLEQKEGGRNPALVKTFNTILLELTLLGKTKIKPPKELGNMKLKRDYYGCILVDFNFRGIPQRISQRADYVFGGKTEITFRGYALNSDELAKLEEELDESDVSDALKLIEGTTTESLDKMKEEIDFFLEEESEKEVEEKKKFKGINPFSALLGKYDKVESPKEKKSEHKIGQIQKDDWIETNHLRKFAAEKAQDTTFLLYDIYKKAHGMVSYT